LLVSHAHYRYLKNEWKARTKEASDAAHLPEGMTEIRLSTSAKPLSSLSSFRYVEWWIS